MIWKAPWTRKSIKIEWKYSTRGYLWRLLPSSDGFFVLEDRNIELKEVRFACLDRQTGKILWENVRLPEKWWITVDTVDNGMVFLHEYASPDMPEQKKIYALDIRSGELTWSNDEMKMMLIHEHSVFACKDGLMERTFFELDRMTGKIVKEIGEDAIEQVRMRAAVVKEDLHRLPALFEGGAETGPVARSVQQVIKKAATPLLIEVLELQDFVVTGYYEQSSPAERPLRQSIVVTDRSSGNIVFSDVVSIDAAVAVPETFFSMNSFVYYIKNKKELTALNLSKS